MQDGENLNPIYITSKRLMCNQFEHNTMGPFGYNLFLLKLKTENTIAK